MINQQRHTGQLPNTPLKAVFMGTPGFAATILAHVLQDPSVTVTAVYCQPDRPAGRGKALKMPEVKELALQHNIPVLQPLNFKDEADVATLATFAPDVLLVAAYGLILPQKVLDIPTYMPINVHASLLPKYRGAAPIQRAIMDGEAITGITIMKMEAGLDTGPILLQRAVGIDINDTSATLHDELATEGGELLCNALHRLIEGKLTPIVQEDAKATHAAKLSKEESKLHLHLPSQVLHARIRGMSPWPGANITLMREGQEPTTVLVAPGQYPLTPEVTAFATKRIDEKYNGTLPAAGTILGVYADCLCVCCGNGFYAFTSLRPAGKKAMDGKAFFNGYIAGATCPHFLAGQ